MVDRTNRYRSGVLKIATGIVILTLGKLLLWTPAGSRHYSQPVFPDALTLNHPLPCDWTTSATETCAPILLEAAPAPNTSSDDPSPLEPLYPEYENSEYEQVVAQKHYTHQDLSLSVYYVVNTSGDMYPLLADHGITVPTDPEQFQDQSSTYGTYRLFSAGQKTHLVSCLNPNGPASSSIEQFRTHRRRYDLHWSHWGKWLFGQTRLKDTRCLWINLAISNDGTTRTSNHQKNKDRLQDLWQELAPQWQQHFPKP